MILPFPLPNLAGLTVEAAKARAIPQFHPKGTALAEIHESPTVSQGQKIFLFNSLR
ncbi:hypothetical protein [Mesorhizobium sp. IMUNJ 23232]|uniref:hypothetical protein n=1 Tax=Mesorhizobium sp. IMUNJ 23232 TaxID=3376064 RepID=UPI0037BB5470